MNHTQTKASVLDALQQGGLLQVQVYRDPESPIWISREFDITQERHGGEPAFSMGSEPTEDMKEERWRSAVKIHDMDDTHRVNHLTFYSYLVQKAQRVDGVIPMLARYAFITDDQQLRVNHLHFHIDTNRIHSSLENNNMHDSDLIMPMVEVDLTNHLSYNPDRLNQQLRDFFYQIEPGVYI